MQEALTSARRHAPGSPTRVTFYRGRDLVGVRVENALDPSAGPVDAKPGRGLLGMRERVEALGSDVTTEAHDGTFRLIVALPVPVGAEVVA